MEKVPKYYSYMIIFRSDIEDVQPIIEVSDLEKLRLDNQERTHLFDEDMIPILSGVEYCLHMPRTEMDTYDVDTRVLDNAYDVPQNICIFPDTYPNIEQVMSQFTFIIYADNCLERVKKSADSSDAELGAMSVLDLSQETLKNHWESLFHKRVKQYAEKLKDIEKQFLLLDDKQLILPALATVRQYDNVGTIYNMIFNSINIFEICTNVIWSQLVHHNALMSCSNYSGKDSDAFRKMYNEGKEKAKKDNKNECCNYDAWSIT